MRKKPLSTLLKLLLAMASLSVPGLVSAEKVCRDDGVIVQILGSGGPEIDDRQGGPSFLIWIDGKARVLIDTGPGSSVAFDKAEANFADLHAILFTHLHTDHTADFVSFIKGSYFADREEQLVVLGPDSNAEQFPDTETFVERLIGPNGAYPYLSDFLTYKSSGGYRVRARNVPSTGNRKWARFGRDGLRISAIPVNHSIVPAVAWRLDIGEGDDRRVVVATGDFNNEKNVVPKFAKGADAIIFNHAIPENARGSARELHILPSQIGRIADQAEARMVILAHRMNRTLGRESQTRNEIEENYGGYLLFANDGECWGL